MIKSISKTSSTKKDWTKITFKPDLTRFSGMTHLDANIVALMTKRVHDIGGSNQGMKVELNGAKLPIKNFMDYVNLYLKPAGAAAADGAAVMPPLPIIHEKFGDRWEVVVSISDGQFQQVSFVNSIATIRGGTHVRRPPNPLHCGISPHPPTHIMLFEAVAFSLRGPFQVNHVTDQITKELVDHVKKKNKTTLKPFQVKNHIWVFVNCLIENPAFDSQTK